MHAEFLARHIPGAVLAAVFDIDRATAGGVAAMLAADAVSTADELIRSPDVDAIAICTSTDTHVELIESAARAGKAVFCEKPIAHDLAHVDRALAAVDQAGVPFMVGFNRRFDPAHRSVRNAVASGAVGDVHLVRITSRDPEPPPLSYVLVSGGIFLDMTIHDFDMARYVTGSDVVEVVARGAVQIDPSFAHAGDIDTAVVTLAHESGALTTIDNSRRTTYGFDQRVEAFGSDGMAASENPLTHTGVVHSATGTNRPGLPHFFLERYRQSYLDEWDAFITAVRDGAPSPVSGADGRAALVAALAAGRSLRDGSIVRVAEVC